MNILFKPELTYLILCHYNVEVNILVNSIAILNVFINKTLKMSHAMTEYRI